MPERMATQRPRKIRSAGIWKGRSKTRSRNSCAMSCISRGSRWVSSCMLFPHSRSKIAVLRLPQPPRVGPGEQNAQFLVRLEQPIEHRARPVRWPGRATRAACASETCPTMPKSTNTSRQPDAPFGSTNRLPGWGSAWKKPSLEDLPQVGGEQPLRHLGPVHAGGVDRGVVRDLDGVDVLERQDAGVCSGSAKTFGTRTPTSSANMAAKRPGVSPPRPGSRPPPTACG